jgi:hypothetical protein
LHRSDEGIITENASPKARKKKKNRKNRKAKQVVFEQGNGNSLPLLEKNVVDVQKRLVLSYNRSSKIIIF